MVINPIPTSRQGRARASREANRLGLNAAETAVEARFAQEEANTRAAAQAAVQRSLEVDQHDEAGRLHGVGPWQDPPAAPTY